MSNVTIFGAVSNVCDKLVFKLGKTTDTLNFVEFIEEIINKMDLAKFNYRKPVLVMDSHAVHKSRGTRPWLKKFRVLYLPAYSSYLNPVESVWSLMKRNIHKELARIKFNIRS